MSYRWPGDKPYISPSQLESYTRCGEAYRRRYIMGHRLPPGVAGARGTAIHKGAEHNFAQKIETRQDRPAQEVVDVAVAVFEGTIANEGVFMSDEDRARGEKIVIGEEKDATVALAKAMAREMFPRHQPTAVEQRQKIALPESSHDLQGILDLVNDRQEIVDIKSTGRKMTQADVDSSNQFTFYGLTYRAAHGKDPAGIVVENLVNKKEAEVVQLATSRTDLDYQALINRLNAMLAGLKAGVFMPATPGGWWCSARFCGYHGTCPYVNGQRKGAAGIS